MRFEVALVLALASVPACNDGPTTPTVPSDRAGRWQQDIDSFARQLSALHANLFFRLSRARFESEIASLRGAAPSLSDEAIVVGLMRILSLVGDSHTTIDPRSVPGFRQLPIRFDWFQDGIFVVGAIPDYRQALGLRLARLGDAPVQAVIDSLREVIPYENESWLRFSLVSLLTIPEVLEAQSLIPDAARVRLELEAEGGQSFQMEIPSEPRQARDFLDAGLEAPPLYRQRPEDNYWLELLEGSQTLYVQYRQASDGGAESFAQFGGRVIQILDTEPVRALVIDVRNNTGGNSGLMEPLLVALERRPQWSSGEGLYAIIGRATFSSALINAVDLKRRLRATLVGEPTGGKPNHYGQVSFFTLANSGIRVSYSTRFFRLLADSDPVSLEPDVRVEVTSRDYLEGKDPVLETVLGFVGR